MTPAKCNRSSSRSKLILMLPTSLYLQVHVILLFLSIIFKLFYVQLIRLYLKLIDEHLRCEDFSRRHKMLFGKPQTLSVQSRPGTAAMFLSPPLLGSTGPVYDYATVSPLRLRRRIQTIITLPGYDMSCLMVLRY